MSSEKASCADLPRLPRLLACARRVPDFRVDRRRKHVLAEIIFIAVAARTVVGEAMVPEKAGEITAMPALIRRLPIRGAVVTADAAGCQREVARAVAESRADYVLALKGNQGTMEEEMRALLEDIAAREPRGHASAADKGHGRLETRRLWMTTDLGWYADKPKWRNLRSAAMVECERTKGGETTVERRLFISSLDAAPDRMMAYVRGHWGVENSLHWTLDVTFGEDQSRARWRNAPQNLAALRRLAVSRLLACGDPDMSVRRKTKMAALSTELLSEVVM